MAREPTGPNTPPRTESMELNGNLVLQALKNAGMDPARLNLREILGSRVDIEELQARLHRPQPDAEWHFHFTVSPK